MKLDLGIAEANLIHAACTYVDASPGQDALDSGQLYEELETAREQYREALIALSDADREREETGRRR